ncbi:hypothetical protein VNO77_40933 [Canavalia gladiata]|uniref:Zinc finger protein 706 n=1 Tax=Canavalia gladiata TaxID=3824 RepID=A0AAN9K162_CANGL
MTGFSGSFFPFNSAFIKHTKCTGLGHRAIYRHWCLPSVSSCFRDLRERKLGSSGFFPVVSDMGGGNGQKAKMAREKNVEKQKAAKGSQLGSNKKAMSIQCKVCMQTFMCTTSEVKCREHAEAKHPKTDIYTCFPHLKE